MYVSSKLATGRLLAIALAIILWSLVIPAQKANAEKKNHTSQDVQKGCQTCPVDPKVIAKQKKAEEHAQHEAAEACQRRQKEIAHAQHEAEEAQARAAEKQQAVAELGGGMCKSTETASEEKTQPEPDISRVKPTPEPAPVVIAPVPVPVPETPPAPTVQPTPAPAPEETSPAPPEAPSKPKAMPKTASPLSLIGLIGLVSMSGGYLTRFFRR